MSLAEDLNPPRVPVRFESAEAFLDWVERQPVRHELVDGEAWAMAGASPNHNRISRNTLSGLTMRLAQHRCEPFGSDQAVLLGPLQVVFPDVTVSCEPVSGRGIEHPVVIVEVLSPSTLAYDMGEKAAAYRAMPSLRHLVLIHQDRIAAEHHHRATADMDFTITDLASVDAMLRLAAVGVEITLAELYARVTF